MSNYSDFPNISVQGSSVQGSSVQGSALGGEDLRSIQRNLNTLIKDIQTIKSDIALIKLYIKEREQERDISKGWWY